MSESERPKRARIQRPTSVTVHTRTRQLAMTRSIHPYTPEDRDALLAECAICSHTYAYLAVSCNPARIGRRAQDAA